MKVLRHSKFYGTENPTNGVLTRTLENSVSTSLPPAAALPTCNAIANFSLTPTPAPVVVYNGSRRFRPANDRLAQVWLALATRFAAMDRNQLVLASSAAAAAGCAVLTWWQAAQRASSRKASSPLPARDVFSTFPTMGSPAGRRNPAWMFPISHWIAEGPPATEASAAAAALLEESVGKLAQAIERRPRILSDSQTLGSPGVARKEERGAVLRRAAYDIDESLGFLNHGSYGSVIRPCAAAQKFWREQVRLNPPDAMEHLVIPELVRAVRCVAAFVNADARSVALVPNATSGVNCVLQSLWLRAGGTVLSFDVSYGAIRNSIDLCVGRQRGEGCSAATLCLPRPFDAEALVSSLDDRFATVLNYFRTPAVNSSSHLCRSSSSETGPVDRGVRAGLHHLLPGLAAAHRAAGGRVQAPRRAVRGGRRARDRCGGAGHGGAGGGRRRRAHLQLPQGDADDQAAARVRAAAHANALSSG